MKKVIIILIIFSLVFISFFVFKKDEKIENKNISVILETEEGNIETNKFPSKKDYEYLSTECENTSDNINTIFNESTWKLNLSVEEEKIDGEFNCTVHFRENAEANKPVLDKKMVPVYYSNANSTWKVADKENKSTEHKWYDYENKMWANSVTYDQTRAYNQGNTYEGKVFNGANYVDAGNKNYDFNKEITVISRFKKLNGTTSEHIISNAAAAGFYINVSGSKIKLYIYGEKAKAYKSITSTTTVEEDKWYTVVGTYNGTILKLYVNGELEVSLSFNDTIKPSSVPIFIGANPEGDGTHQSYFKGTISDAIVINECLSEEEIKEYCSDNINYQKNSNLIFYKKFGNQETYLTNANYNEEGVLFDGSTSYINAGYASYDFGNKLTVIARFKFDDLSLENQMIVGNPANKGFFITVQGNKVFFGVYGNSQMDYKYISSSVTLNTNTWYTAVGVFNGTSMSLYLNGELEGSVNLNDSIKSSGFSIHIGANPDDNGKFSEYTDGIVSDAIVINDVLSEEEIKENYSGEVNYKENDKTLFAYDLQGYEGREAGSIVPMEAISTMQVWIPRYKYKVWNYNLDGTKTSKPQEIEIKFEKGTNTTGDIKCTDNIQGEDGDGTSEVCTINNEECSDNLCNGAYYTHPAFTFGSVDLTGFWVGKFEITGNIENITTKPNISSIRNERVGDFETNIMKMNDSGNKYGISSTTDTHMIKNSEWGAVAYLSHSKYGTCTNGICKEIGTNNNSNYITGCGATPGSSESATCNSYETELGSSASTTGNIYGVYDMSAGAFEYVMGNVVSNNKSAMMSGYNSTSNSGYSGVIYNAGNYTTYTGSYTYPEDKYYDKYSFGTASNQRKKSKLGDAVKEVLNTSSFGWYGDYSGLAYSGSSWFIRGGYYDNNSGAGIFYSGTGNGYKVSYTSSRISLHP